MATEIYLGNPPQHVIDWIKAHSKPVVSPKTKITFTDGSVEEYDWSGNIDFLTMHDAGIYFRYTGEWIKKPQTVEIGTNVTSIGESTFNRCKSLTNITIPNSVTSIGEQAFNDCGNLKNVVISEGITSIGNMAFNYCYSLTNITIPNSVTSIGEQAFSSCSGLTSIIVEGRTTAQARALLANAGLSDINIVTGSIPG